jgi:SNF2 family DNA or RNA helicase
LEQINFEYIIIDEAHYIKNRESKIFKALNAFHAKNKVSLSGTPIENSLADLWSQMQFINPDILLSYGQFKKMYQDPIEKERDEKAIIELKQLLHPFILRRTKKEVLTDLPDTEEQIYYCDMEDDQRKLVDAEKSKARNTLLNATEDIEHSKIHVFNALMRLRQLSNHPKLVDAQSEVSSCKYTEVTNTIDTLVKGENKVLIFSTFLGQLEIYKTYLESNNIGYSILTGAHNAKQRAKAVDDFQNEESCKVMLISITAGNTGLNLTAANYVILLDPWWNPFIEEQAKGRAHRIGQLRQVTFIKFITKDTIEEKILSLQERKLKLSMDFMDERGMPEFDKETLGYLLS